MWRRLRSRRWLLTLTLVVTLTAAAGAAAAVRRHIRRSERPIPAPFIRILPKGPTAPEFAPARLAVDANALDETITDLNGAPIHAPYPVSVVHREGSLYYVCNYKQLFLIDLECRQARVVPPPDYMPSGWRPTGLAYDAHAQKLYVANYSGGDVLVCDASEPNLLVLTRRVTHPDLKGPEGVDFGSDGSIAVADYDGNAVFLFDAAGKLLWKHAAELPHGVAVLRQPGRADNVLATSLGGTAVLRLDRAGRLRARFGGAAWHDGHGYVYPTSVTAGPNGTLFVTDAFRGQVSLLDDDLNVFATLGGNGPGAGLFNNPYAACPSPDGERLLVADTFRDRLVEVRLRDRAVVASYRLVDAARVAVRTTYPDKRCDLAALRPLPLPTVPTAAEPFGRGLAVFLSRGAPVSVEEKTFVTLPLPRFTEATAPNLGDRWRPAIMGLASAGKYGVCVGTQGLGGLFAEYPHRFVFARNYEVEGETYLLLVSPQSADALVIGRGAAASLALCKDIWPVGETLVGPDFVLPPRRLVAEGARRIRAFRESPASGPPLEAIRSAFFPWLKADDFAREFRAAMRTPVGHDFARDCLAAADADGQRAAAERYFEALRAPGALLELSEALLAEMVLSAGS